jgi:hypothetical protein
MEDNGTGTQAAAGTQATGTQAAAGAGAAAAAGANPEAGQQGQQTQQQAEKTFTQTEVNALMAKEKRDGKRSVLTALGVKTVDEAKSLVGGSAQGQQTASQQNTEEATAQGVLQAERLKTQQAEQRAAVLQFRFDVIEAGVLPKFADDAVAIALPRCTDAGDMKTVLTEMKTTHPFFFAASGAAQQNNENSTNNGQAQQGNSAGTGTAFGANGTGAQGASAGDYGKKLAEANKASSFNVDEAFFGIPK